MVKEYGKYRIYASRKMPDPRQQPYWADLGEDPTGSTVKVWDGSKWTILDNELQVMTGGLSGQVLTKASNADFDFSWTDAIGDVSYVDGPSSGTNFVDNANPKRPIINHDPDKLNVADLPANLVQDANYVHTDNNYTNTEKTKLSGIADGADVSNNATLTIKQSGTIVGTFTANADTDVEVDLSDATWSQADWDEQDTGAQSYINNKPSLAKVATSGEYSDLLNIPANIVTDAFYVHTDSNYTTGDKSKLAGIEVGAEVNVQSDWAVNNQNSDAYILNKPENLVQDANYVHTDNNFTDAYEAQLDSLAITKYVLDSATDTNSVKVIKGNANVVIADDYVTLHNQNSSNTTLSDVNVADDYAIITSNNTNAQRVTSAIVGPTSLKLSNTNTAASKSNEVELTDTTFTYNGNQVLTSVDIDDKANKVIVPHVDWALTGISLTAGRVLKFDTAKTPTITTTDQSAASYTTAAGSQGWAFGVYTADTGATTHIGYFKWYGSPPNWTIESIVDVYDSSQGGWLNNGEYTLRYDEAIDWTQTMNSLTINGFDLTTDITVKDVAPIDLSDALNYLNTKQNKLKSGQNVDINNIDPINPVIGVRVYEPDTSMDYGKPADARYVANQLAEVSRSTHNRGSVVSAYTPIQVYAANVSIYNGNASTGAHYEVGDSLQYGLDLKDILIVVTAVDGSGAITAFTTSSAGANTVDPAITNPVNFLGGHGSNAEFDLTFSTTNGSVLADVPNPAENDTVTVLKDELHKSTSYEWVFADTNGDSISNWIALAPAGSSRNFIIDPITNAELAADAVKSTNIINGEVKLVDLETDIQTKLGYVDVTSSVKDSLDAKVNKANTASVLYGTAANSSDTTYPLTNFEAQANKVDIINTDPSLASTIKYPTEHAASTSLATKEDVANKVTTLSVVPDDDHYPSEKLVNDMFVTKVNITNTNNKVYGTSDAGAQTTFNKVTTIAVPATALDTNMPTEKAVSTSLANKVNITSTSANTSTNIVNTAGDTFRATTSYDDAVTINTAEVSTNASNADASAYINATNNTTANLSSVKVSPVSGIALTSYDGVNNVNNQVILNNSGLTYNTRPIVSQWFGTKAQLDALVAAGQIVAGVLYHTTDE